MPIVPMIGQAQENLNVPAPAQQNVAAAGVVDRAIGEAAGKVSELGVALVEKRKKAADNDFAFKTYVDDYQAIEKYSQDLKINSPEDAAGYTDKMSKFLSDRRTANEKQAPSDDGLKLYREKAATLYKGAEIEAQNFENTTRAKYYVKSMDESANRLASSFLSNPDYTKAKDVQRTLENELDANAQTHFVDPGTREKLKQQMRDSVSMSVFDGLDAQERYHEQIKLLKNTDAGTDIFGGMNAEKRGALLRRAESGAETQRRQGDADLKGRIADVMDAQMKGDDVDPEILNSLGKRIQTSGLRPDEKEKYGDSLQIAGIVSSEKKRLMNTPMSLWGSVEDILPNRPDAANARVVNKAQAVLAREMTQLQKEARQDPATYALRSSPELQKSFSAIEPGNAMETQDFDQKMVSRQNALGIGRTKILPSGQSQAVANNFINQTPDEAAKSALALKAAHGKFAPKIFAEIAKDGKLPSDFMLVPYLQTPAATAAVIENMKNEPKITQAFKDKTKISDPTVRATVSQKMESFSDALANQGTSALSLSNALQNQVMIEAKKRMVLNADSNLSTAVDNAMETVVKSNFVPIKAARSNFIMPKFTTEGRQYSEDSVKAFVNAYSVPEGFAALNVAIPKSVVERMPPQTEPDNLGKFMGGRKETPKDRFYGMLEKTGYWTPSPDNSELVLAMKVDGKPIAVLDESGNAVKRSFHEITFDQDERTLRAATPMWKRVFKSNTAQAKGK